MANVGDLLIAEAKKHLGKPYVWATHGPNTFDCSGFTYYVTKQVQPSFVIYTGTASQWYQGTVVPLSAARPGDFVFYVDPPGSTNVTHVGFYVSPTELIHAANESTGVIISNGISGSWYAERLYQVRRLFPYDDAQAGDGGTTPPPTGGSAYATGDLIQVVDGPLNMRSGAGTGYGIVTSLAVGTQLCVTGNSTLSGGYEWVPVKISGSTTTGFVAKQFTGLLTAGGCAAPPPPPPPDPEPEPEPEPPPAPTGYQNGDKIRVTEGVLNMRSGAGTGYGVILGLQTGTELCVTGNEVASGGYTWVPVKLSGGTTAGWVVKQFTAMDAVGGCNTVTPPPTDPPPTTTWTHKVTTGTLNMRSGAGTNFGIIATLPVGTRLRLLSSAIYSGGYTWYKVEAENKGTGFIVNGFDPI